MYMRQENLAHVVTDLEPSNTDLAIASFPAVPGIEETAEKVSFLGVSLPKGAGGLYVPGKQRFADHVMTLEDLKLARDIAVAFDLGQPFLVEGGTGLGKSDIVDHMCARLNWECYYINCRDFDPELVIGRTTAVNDPNSRSGFGWVDGLAMRAVRKGPENVHKVLVFDEYNFMNPDTRAALHQILDAVLNKKDRILLPENNGEIVAVDPNTRIIAMQNPPGGKYTDREILDIPQITRFVYSKLSSDFPLEMRRQRALGTVGAHSGLEIPELAYLHQSPDFSREKLKQIPGMPELIQKFVEFGHTLEQLVENRRLALDQPQPVYFSFQRDLRRMMDFAVRFYDGDIYGTFRRGMEYYFQNRFESKEDRAQVAELIARFKEPDKGISKRKNLDGTEAVKKDEADLSLLELPPVVTSTQQKIMQQAAPPRIRRPERDLNPDEELQYATLERLNKLHERGATPLALVPGLSGLNIEPAWEWRTWMLGQLTHSFDKLTVAETLAGINTPQARSWKREMVKIWMELDLQNKSRVGHTMMRCYAGDNSNEAWSLRLEGARNSSGDRRPFKNFASNYEFLRSLNGIDSQPANEQREKIGSFFQKNLTSQLVSYAGMETEKAWALREKIFSKYARAFYGAPMIQAVMDSLALVESERADKFRVACEEIVKDPSVLVRAYRGLSSDSSFEKRIELLGKGARPESVAFSLCGVTGAKAEEMRDQIMEVLLKGNADKLDMFVRGLYGSYVISSIKQARREGSKPS
jgi:MoxR-like ATPase